MLLLLSISAIGLMTGGLAFAGEASTEPTSPPATDTAPQPTSVPEAAPATPPSSGEAPVIESTAPPEEVLVIGVRIQLLGQATTSSQGIVLKDDLNQLPTYRAAQVLEAVPGLVVTSHSGEGKANQYLVRGFNLDHGTDLSTFVDGMPVNMRTHAHGQGYTDLNFFVPELASGMDYTKGPYFAAEGDYSAVASVHIKYLNEIDDQASATVGTLGYQRLFTAGTRDALNGKILGGVELIHYDGPWTHSDDVRKLNGVVRYSQGDATEGFSVTAMYYRDLWNATTDQPLRAMDPAYATSVGVTPIGRFGTLDPSDGGQAQRMSLSGMWSHGTLSWHADANLYVINSNLTLWNNFTHFLDDPVNGDQHAQNDIRTIYGGGLSFTHYGTLFGGTTETLVGIQGRYDDIHVDLIHTRQRMKLATFEDDSVQEGSEGIYVQYTDYVNDWFRFVAGLREDHFEATDTGTNAGTATASMFQPKGSLIFTPFTNWEFYVSAGRGFHSNDFRGLATGGTFLVPAVGEEVGIRATPVTGLTATLTAFQMQFRSELTYDADVGQTSAGRPSKRQGLELNLTYQVLDWLEFYGSASYAHSRYTDTSLAGAYIPDAPSVISQFGIFVRDLGHWSGALEMRYLGPHPLLEDNSVTSPGYQEWNANVGYDFGDGFKAQLAVFNLFDSHKDAADYYYADRISPAEPLSDPAGNPDMHIHPLEPRAFRLTVSKTF